MTELDLLSRLKSQSFKITFCEHDGSLLPKLSNAPTDLIDSLRSNGAEILNDGMQDSYLVYVQQYSEEEQFERDGGEGFHGGFSIFSFFKENNYLIEFIDKKNLAEISEFLDAATQQLLEK